MSIVFVDTDFLIWCVQKESTKGQEEMVRKAEHALNEIIKNKDRIAVSSISVGEFLGGIPQELRGEYEREISNNFIIVPFDIVAARKSAIIHYDKFNASKKSHPGGRKVLKADIQILGCLLRLNPNIFYCNDKGLLKISIKYFNKTLPLPDLPMEHPPII